jgi:hypothetical protein
MSMMDRELAPGEAGELFDVRQAQQIFGMLFRSVKRHLTRSLLAFLVISSAAILLGYSTPKQYSSYSVMELKPTQLTPELISPGEPVTVSDPRKGVRETVLRQSNLESIVDKLGLVAELRANRGLVSRGIEKIKPPVADIEADKRDAIDVLRSSIDVTVPITEGQYETIIAVKWPNPVTATNIARSLQDNFIEERRTNEVTQIRKIVAILSDRAIEAQKGLDEVNSRIGNLGELEIPASDRGTLDAAQRKQSSVQATLEKGQLKLQSAESDFDTRYSVSQAPQVPKRALNGRSKSYVLGLVAGLMAALFVAALADLTKGAFVESWQITRKLSLPVLAELKD